MFEGFSGPLVCVVTSNLPANARKGLISFASRSKIVYRTWVGIPVAQVVGSPVPGAQVAVSPVPGAHVAVSPVAQKLYTLVGLQFQVPKWQFPQFQVP